MFTVSPVAPKKISFYKMRILLSFEHNFIAIFSYVSGQQQMLINALKNSKYAAKDVSDL